MNHHPRDYRALLLGRSCISYSRFSSAPQEWGDSMRRQRGKLDEIIRFYGLREDLALLDKAKSASKGRHRTHGQLGDLLKSAQLELIPRGTVIAIEAMDRLHRGGMMAVFEVLQILCEHGLLLVDGQMRVWDEETINSSANIMLVSDINAAKAYTDRLSDYSNGVQRAKRSALAAFKEALARDPDAIPPHMTASPPAWVVKTKCGYAEHPVYAPIVREIFDLCIAGYSVRQIAEMFNRESRPTFTQGKNGTRTRAEWAAPRIGLLLRNRIVLGLVTPKKRNGTGREVAGPEVKIYPVVIGPDVWLKAREVLGVRQKTLRGRRGDQVKNLFTGHVFCKTCNAAMRVDSGGGAEKNNRVLICSRFIENRTCADKDRYDLNHYERYILFTLVRNAAPQRPVNEDARKLAEDLAAIRVTISGLDEDMNHLRGKTADSPSRREQYDRAMDDKDTLLKRAADLEIRIASVSAPKARTDEMMDFIKTLIGPALQGDTDARERLRTLLARLEYRLTGHRFEDGSETMRLEFPFQLNGQKGYAFYFIDRIMHIHPLALAFDSPISEAIVDLVSAPLAIVNRSDHNE